MKLICLGSSSKGNCYILQTDNGKCLVIEMGVPFNEVKKAINYQVNSIDGIVVSHSHSDHSGYVEQCKFIDVYMSADTKQERGLTTSNIKAIEPLQTISIGNFRVMAFDVKHDVRCYGYLINHKECGNVLFMTDFCYTEYTFSNVNNWLVEANYSADILNENVQSGNISQEQYNRTVFSHASIETCKETLLANNLQSTNNVVLIHLSDGNSNAVEFQQRIHKATGKTVHIADKGMTLRFNKTPF
jgi:phosphoribosyl 1,2-cyclic phosphodiesterase